MNYITDHNHQLLITNHYTGSLTTHHDPLLNPMNYWILQQCERPLTLGTLAAAPHTREGQCMCKSRFENSNRGGSVELRICSKLFFMEACRADSFRHQDLLGILHPTSNDYLKHVTGTIG